MSSLRRFLTEKGYQRTKLKTTATNHLELVASINNIEGNFILDTGASSSCIGREMVEYFDLFAEDSDVKAAGAGATNMLTQVSTKNTVAINNWKKKKIDLVVFDLSHVNQALTDHKAEKVHGIIGADILKKGKAVIDYKTKTLYLK
ncbi:Aspartyl protease [Mesonia phycicola]|uniref:Aspartyl protease n=1 Tax=Mesonia phycicola TaxID=579105 RepID=A0A1M6ERA4_9FLAO|nr:retropepsin-like aspartic protease [Mesonia phycicola]SHI87997.1 Aspartyl protease [Mesonia phycicola]